MLTFNRPSLMHPLLSKRQIVYVLSSIISANKSTSVTHGNKLDNKATTKVYRKLDNRATIKASSKLALKHLQTSNHHHNFSELLSIQLSRSLVRTMNSVSNASLSSSSMLSVNDYESSLFNTNTILNALPETSLINFKNSCKTPRSTQMKCGVA